MKKRILSLLCLCTLLAGLLGAAPAVAAGRYQFKVLPVTEAGVRTLYSWEGSRVVKITPCEGDFLVEYTDMQPGETPPPTLLDWVFGATGRRVQLGGMEYYTGYRIVYPGCVEATTTGASAVVPFKGLPGHLRYTVLGDANGVITKDMSACVDSSETSWVDPRAPLFDAPKGEGSRYEQLYDARITADGLSLSFIPSGDPERFYSFFPAVTSVPLFTTRYDEKTGQFTLRLYNTCLKSGGIDPARMEAFFGGLDVPYAGISYPYEFPSGSLGRDSHFLTGVTVQADGEDTVITARLTDRAYRSTVEWGNLGYDNIPTLRLVFREHNGDMDKT